MSLQEEFEKKKLLNGTVITKLEADVLIETLPTELVPPWYAEILQKYLIVGVCFTLDKEYDQSGLGLELKWLSPEQTIEEALDVYPGKSVASLGYLPVGGCMSGSGDPYFLKLKNGDAKDPALVRVPHDYASGVQYPEDVIELVCESLSEFIKLAEIE